MAEDLEIPIGFRFYLSDQEVIEYLESKVSNPLFQLPNEILQVYSLYGEYDPWTLPFEDGTNSDDEDKDRDDQYLYFFTTLKRKSTNKIERTAGSGTWNGQRTQKIYGEGRLENVKIGLEKTFDFVLKNNDDSNPNHPRKEWQYIMHEFSQLKYGGDSVICRIRRKRPVGYQEEQQRLAILKRKKPAVAVHEEPAAIVIHEEPAAAIAIQEEPAAIAIQEDPAAIAIREEAACMNSELNSWIDTTLNMNDEDFKSLMSMFPLPTC